MTNFCEVQIVVCCFRVNLRCALNLIYFSAQFSGLTVTFSFQRRWIYYVYQVYVPCICITVLSWIGFWIDHKAVPARTGLGITTVLTMVYMLASVNSNLPRVTYLKSIDNFVLVCFGFIFLTSLEYVVAIRFSQSRKEANDRKSQKTLSQNLSVSSGKFFAVHNRVSPLQEYNSHHECHVFNSISSFYHSVYSQLSHGLFI